MKILFYTQYFSPETNAPANRLGDMAKFLSGRHSVSVLTGFPNHPLGKMFLGYKNGFLKKEMIGNISVFRSFMVIPKKLNSKIYRYLNYLSFAFSSFINLFRLEKPDLIIVSSPPISVLVMGFFYAKIRKVPMIIDLRDLWPEAAISLKVISKGVITTLLEKLVFKSYRYAKKILINTEGFEDILTEGYKVNSEKIIYLPNGFNIEENLDIKSETNLKNPGSCFKVFYSGLFGWAQNVELIVKTAQVAFNLNSNIQFVLIGDGALKDKLKSLIKEYGLNNISIIDYQEKKNLFKIIRDCDLGLITYEINDTFRKNIPSKMFDYMFLEKPVLINLKGEASGIIEKGGFGFCLETNNPVEFFNKINNVSKEPGETKGLGKNGFEYLENNFNKKDLLKKLENAIGIDF